MSYTDAERLAFDPFEGDEAELKLRTAHIRTARKEYPCYALANCRDGHTIKPGDRYRHERALVDGEFWGEYRICTRCLDKWIAELHGDEDEYEEAEG